MKRFIIVLAVINLTIALASLPLWHAHYASAVGTLLGTYERRGEERPGQPRDYSDKELALFKHIEQSSYDMGIATLVVHSLQAVAFLIAGVSLRPPQQHVEKRDGRLQVVPLTFISLLLVMNILLFFPLLPGVIKTHSVVLWNETVATYGHINDEGSFAEEEFAARRAVVFPRWAASLGWFYLVQATTLIWICCELNIRYLLNEPD